MRIARTRRRDARFTGDSALRGMVLRMLSTNTLIGLAEPATGLGGHRPVTGATRVWEVIPSRAEAAPPQRPLEAVPPQPGRPLPRGSLLDLRV